MIITQPKLAASIRPDPDERGAYHIILVMEPDCDIEVAQTLADKEQQLVKVYRKSADPDSALYEVSHVYPNLEINLRQE